MQEYEEDLMQKSPWHILVAIANFQKVRLNISLTDLSFINLTF